LNESKTLDTDVETHLTSSAFQALMTEKRLSKSIDYYFLYFVLTQLDEKNDRSFRLLISKISLDDYLEFFKKEGGHFLKRCYSELFLHSFLQQDSSPSNETQEYKRQILMKFYEHFDFWISSTAANEDRKKLAVYLLEVFISRQNSLQLHHDAAHERTV
jgi:hypothetical protein